MTDTLGARMDGSRRWLPMAPRRAWVGLGPLVAVAAVGLGLALGWRGVDMAAAVHRVSEFRADGFLIWDNSWYGGLWTLNYSVVFAPVASAVGLHLLALAAAAGAALGFERVVTPHFGPSARPAVIVFAVSMVVETAIGQLPYLSGEAVALGALWAATRRKWPLAWVLALGSTLLSPLAGAFLALAALAWLVAGRGSHGRSWGLAVAALGGTVVAPVLVTTLLFPGQGNMPFSALDCSWDLAIALALLVVTPRRQTVLRAGIVIYTAGLLGSYVVPSPVGSNFGRLGDCLALPLATLLLWPRRRILLAALVVPLVASEWGPAWGAMTSLPSQPEAQRAFYRPLDAWLTHADPGGTRGRVEVVPTAAHWEAVWVADVEPLARGWERQSDIATNPIFYRAGALTASSYRAWVLDNGVAYVALPAGPLDFAAQAEGRLVAHGVPGLRPVWHDRDWRVWAVTGSTGLVSGPATVAGFDAQQLVLAVSQPGAVMVRVAGDGHWAVRHGAACAEVDGRWTRLEVTRPGTVVMAATVGSSAGRCPPA